MDVLARLRMRLLGEPVRYEDLVEISNGMMTAINRENGAYRIPIYRYCLYCISVYFTHKQTVYIYIYYRYIWYIINICLSYRTIDYS